MGVASVVAFVAAGSSCTAGDESGRQGERPEPFATRVATPERVLAPASRRAIALHGVAPDRAEFSSEVELREVAQDDSSLFLSFAHRAELLRGQQPAEAPEVLIHAGGRSRSISGARGRLLLGGNAPEWLSLPLAELPEGDMELTIRFLGAGAQHTVLLRKKGTQLTALRVRDLEGYREIASVDPETRKTVRVATIDGPAHDVVITAGEP